MKVSEKESFTGVIYSSDSSFRRSHLSPSRREHTRHMGICGTLKDLGGTDSFHNSFQSLNTLTSGNSSLYLTYSPPPAVNTHFRFLLSSVRMENSCAASFVFRLFSRDRVLCSLTGAAFSSTSHQCADPNEDICS